MALAIARALDPAGFGGVVFALSCGLLVAQIAASGWPQLAQRMVSAYVATRQWALLRGFLRRGDLVVALGASLACGLLYLTGSYILPNGDLADGFTLAALLVPFIAFRKLRRQELAGFSRPAEGLFYDEVLPPIFVTAAAVFSLLIANELSAILFYALGSSVGILLSTNVIKNQAAMREWPCPEYNTKEWFSIAGPMLAGNSSKVAMMKTDVLLLAPLAGLEMVGLYGASFRLTYLLTFPQVVVGMVIGPVLSAVYAANKVKLLRRRYSQAVAFSMLSALPLVLVFLSFPSQILTLIYGEEYVGAADIFVVLSLGQFFAAIAIPSGNMLLMTGRQKYYLYANLASLTINVGLCLLTIPHFGGLGAAWAFCISSLTLLIVQAITVHGSNFNETR